jgi:small subunit ribosomal protein S8
MVLTSTLSNFFSNLTNHSRARNQRFKQLPTQSILHILQLLVTEGYINGYSICDQKFAIVLLKYINGRPCIENIHQFSKPGKRVYVNNRWLYKNKTHHLYVISTNQGIMTQNQAIKLNLGGELICKIS